MIYTELTKKAMKICVETHKEQVDKNGIPYVFHSCHLAEQMQDEYTTVTALLYYIVEDSSITFEYLEKQGIPIEVIDALKLLKRVGRTACWLYEERIEIIRKIKNNEIAKAVMIGRHISDLLGTGRQDREIVYKLKKMDFWYDNKFDFKARYPQNYFSVKVDEYENYYEVILENMINMCYRTFSFKMDNAYINKISINEFAELIEALSPFSNIVDKNKILQDEEIIRLFSVKRIEYDKSANEEKIRELSSWFLSNLEKYFENDKTFQNFECIESKYIYAAMKYANRNIEGHFKTRYYYGLADDILYDSMYSLESDKDVWLIGLSILYICNKDGLDWIEDYQHTRSNSFILLSEKQEVLYDLLSVVDALKPIKNIKVLKCVEEYPEIYRGCRCKYYDISTKTEYGLYIGDDYEDPGSPFNEMPYTFITIKPIEGYPDILTLKFEHIRQKEFRFI